MSATKRIHLNCYLIYGSILNVLRQPIRFSFDLDNPTGYKVFSEPESIHYEKINKSVLNTTTFCLKDDNHEAVSFIQEVLTFKLQVIKIRTVK